MTSQIKITVLVVGPCYTADRSHFNSVWRYQALANRYGYKVTKAIIHVHYLKHNETHLLHTVLNCMHFRAR